jgi:hypothetical protein
LRPADDVAAVDRDGRRQRRCHCVRYKGDDELLSPLQSMVLHTHGRGREIIADYQLSHVLPSPSCKVRGMGNV